MTRRLEWNTRGTLKSHDNVSKLYGSFKLLVNHDYNLVNQKQPKEACIQQEIPSFSSKDHSKPAAELWQALGAQNTIFFQSFCFLANSEELRSTAPGISQGKNKVKVVSESPTSRGPLSLAYKSDLR